MQCSTTTTLGTVCVDLGRYEQGAAARYKVGDLHMEQQHGSELKEQQRQQQQQQQQQVMGMRQLHQEHL